MVLIDSVCEDKYLCIDANLLNCSNKKMSNYNRKISCLKVKLIKEKLLDTNAQVVSKNIFSPIPKFAKKCSTKHSALLIYLVYTKDFFLLNLNQRGMLYHKYSPA